MRRAWAARQEASVFRRDVETAMTDTEVSSRIKSIIGSVAGIDPQKIADDAGLRTDLNLDSLSLLEISVDVDLAFALNLPDEAYRTVENLPAMVELVQRRRAELAGTSAEAQVVGG
jgi:acyl carrier protein